MADIFTPSNANTLSVTIGVPETIDNYIIQNLNITQTSPTLEIQDQTGRVAQVIAYDNQFNVSFTAIGGATAPLSVGEIFDDWKDANGNTLSVIITSVEKACTYNDTAKWNIQGAASTHAKFWNAVNANLQNYQQ